MQYILSLALGFALFAAPSVEPTTWFPADVTCPACAETNKFKVIGSYGSYIYGWPSKFQYIFWPLTDENVVYSCKKCRLTTFMWDFEKVPKEKFEEIAKALKDVSIDANPDYSKIPMSQRLAACEKVYSVLGRSDEDWCRFYRVLGYHLEAESKPKEASAARAKALELNLKLLEKKENQPRRKEFLLVSGSMRYFTGDKTGALKDLEEARGAILEDPDPEKKENANKYLNGVLDEFVAALKDGKKPGEPK